MQEHTLRNVRISFLAFNIAALWCRTFLQLCMRLRLAHLKMELRRTSAKLRMVHGKKEAKRYLVLFGGELNPGLLRIALANDKQKY
jgi:hypothetical protein